MENFRCLSQMTRTYEFNVYFLNNSLITQSSKWTRYSNTLQTIYPTVYLILGTLGNGFHLFIYWKIKLKCAKKLYLPLISVSQTLALYFSMFNQSYIFINIFGARFKYRCLIISFFIRLFSNISNLIYGLIPLLTFLRVRINLATNIAVFILLLVINFIELWFVDLVKIEGNFVCLNVSWPLLKDFVDFSVVLFTPLLIYVLAQAYIWSVMLKSKRNLKLSWRKFLANNVYRIAIAVFLTPTMFILFNFGVAFLPLFLRLYNNGALKCQESEKLMFFIYLFTILYQTQFISTFVLSFSHNEAFRLEVYSFFRFKREHHNSNNSNYHNSYRVVHRINKRSLV